MFARASGEGAVACDDEVGAALVSSTNLIRLPAADPFAPGDVTACCPAAGKLLAADCRSFAADHGSALTSAGLPSGDGSVDTPFCVSAPAPPAPAPARSPWTLPSLMWIPTPHGPREVDLLGRGGGTPLSDGIILRGRIALSSSKSPKTGKWQSGPNYTDESERYAKAIGSIRFGPHIRPRLIRARHGPCQ